MISNVSLPWWAWAAMGVGLVVFIAMIAMTVKRNRGMHRSLFASPYTLWMVIFTVVPVILISYYAFTDANGAFTLDNFKNFWDSHYEANKVIREEEAFRSGDFTFLTDAGEVSEDGATLTIPVSALVAEDGQSLAFLTQRGEVTDSTLVIDVAHLHEQVDYSKYIKRGTVNWDTLVYSLWMAFKCTLICLLLGYPAALFMADRKMKLGSTLVVLFIIPMWMNFLLRTVAWMTLLEDSGLINNLLKSIGFENGVQFMYTSNTVLLGMVYNYLPFMVFPIYTVLNKMDYRLSEAAADLGCNSFQTLYKVTMPLSLPGIVSGITMVFMPSVTTFFIPRVLGGGYTMMFGDLIESKFLTEGNWNAGSALSLLMMLLILASLSILRKADPNGEGGGLA